MLDTRTDIRTSADEKLQWKRAAIRCGVSFSQWMREWLNHGADTNLKEDE